MTAPLHIPGKWVLAGEHAVLHGGRAVALPHPHFYLTGGVARSDDSDASPMVGPSVLLGSLLRELVTQHGVQMPSNYTVTSKIPAGGGLGSSAALCVLAAKIVAATLSFESTDQEQDWVYQAATKLEDRFHGKSSGMDVAAVLAGRPIVFQMGEKPQILSPVWDLGAWVEFHDTGYRMATSQAIQNLKSLELERPAQLALGLRAMEKATDFAIRALQAPGASDGLPWVAQAMNQSWEAFQTWNLIPDPVLSQATSLLERGALAIKLTGAGGGGFLVALWPKPR